MKTTSKTIILLTALIAGVVLTAQAATITTFAELEALTADATASSGDSLSSPPTGISDDADFTFRFDLTTPTDLVGLHEVLEFGGANGTSLILEADRLVFRSAVSGGAIMYVSSNALSTSTTYDVTGSIFLNASGNDELRLYLDQADAIDATQPFHNPINDIGDDWTGGDGGMFGGMGGSGVQIGTTTGNGNGVYGSDFTTTDGTLGTLSMYDDTFLAIPEPSSIALLGLAGLAALFFRRRSA